MDIPELIEQDVAQGLIAERYAHQVAQFYRSYLEWREQRGLPTENLYSLFKTYWEQVRKQCNEPYHFEPFHRAIRTPFDYYRFGIEIIGGIMEQDRSHAFHLEFVDQMEERLQKNENVIWLANHQTEADPQILSILLTRTHQRLAEEAIIVAGERVTTDPLAVPYSLGRNLLCIYSKRHIAFPPERRAEKLAYNMRTMKVLAQLLAEGGKAVYVAPSGGRDRPDEKGLVDVARFDPQAVEMFRFIGNRSPRPCHFYPLALYSHDILPPPVEVERDLGEARYTRGGPAHLAFGAELDLNNFPGAQATDKIARRQAAADYVWKQVKELYCIFPEVQEKRKKAHG